MSIVYSDNNCGDKGIYDTIITFMKMEEDTKPYEGPKSYDDPKPYKCPQCSKAFANGSYLAQHTRIHLGIKPYRCEICERKFTQLSHLQQHIRIHTGDKPYKCHYTGCTKAFSQLSNLQSHSRSHETDKPYKCNSCYKSFSDEPSLHDHISKHKQTKRRLHICQYCGKAYTQEIYLIKHIQKHAENLEKNNVSASGIATENQNVAIIREAAGTAVAVNTISGIPHPFWPKFSPNTALSFVDDASRREDLLQAGNIIQTGNGLLGDHYLAQAIFDRSLLQHHNGQTNGESHPSDSGENLIIKKNQDQRHNIKIEQHDSPPTSPPTPVSEVII